MRGPAHAPNGPKSGGLPKWGHFLDPPLDPRGAPNWVNFGIPPHFWPQIWSGRGPGVVFWPKWTQKSGVAMFFLAIWRFWGPFLTVFSTGLAIGVPDWVPFQSQVATCACKGVPPDFGTPQSGTNPCQELAPDRQKLEKKNCGALS